jgi:hypothetical protein
LQQVLIIKLLERILIKIHGQKKWIQ